MNAIVLVDRKKVEIGPKVTKTRILELDSLRGIAALFVVLYHLTYAYGLSFGSYFQYDYYLEFGRYGVHLFFMISGFVIYQTLQNTLSLKEFAYKRFIRLYPTYWACLLVSFLCIKLFGSTLFPVAWNTFLVNITMIQGLLRVPHVDPAYWSLGQEILFYFSISIIYFSKKANKKIIFISVIWILASLYNKFHPISYIQVIFNLQYSFFFCSGIIFYRYYSKINGKYEYIIILICYLCACIHAKDYTVYASYSIFFCLFFLLCKRKLSWLSKKPLIFLGNISYTLYLLHFCMGYIMINYLRNDLKITNPMLILAIPVVVIIVLAFLITNSIEKPVLKNFSYKRLFSTNF